MNFKLVLLVISVLVADISCDTCDTYKHPTYGLGKCIEASLCPGALYISNLCESKPSTVKCCFSAGSQPVVSGVSCSSTYQKLTHATALSYLSSAGISVSSSGGCSDRTNPKCTSLDQVNCKSISELVNYKRSSGCATILTGGTETGHSSGVQSHSTGFKLDIGLNTCHDSYVRGRFTYIGKRGDGASLYKDTRGNTWALEGNHWDILFP